jgi:hypothetical protein
MVRFFVARNCMETDPLRVIADATLQAIAERAAERVRLKARYRGGPDGIIEFVVQGPADMRMKEFLESLKAFKIVGELTVDRRVELAALGSTTEGHDLLCIEK